MTFRLQADAYLLSMKSALLAIALFFCGLSNAQDSTRTAPAVDVVQISGMVVTGDSLAHLAFATVFRTRDLRGTMTDVNGFFSIPALAGDTITVSSVGYLTQAFAVPRDLELPRMNVVQPLGRDTVALDEAFIYPWPTKERFKEEFLQLQLSPDAYSIGQERLDPAALYDRLMEVGRDGGEVYSYTMQQQAQQNYYAGQLPPINVFNPVAWAKFIDAVRNGSLKRP
jgi:hypothetical protein